MHDGTLVFGPVRGWNGRLNGMDENVKVDVMMSRDGITGAFSAMVP